MVIDFSAFDVRVRPQLILKTADDRIIQPLGAAINLGGSLKYNEISELTFDYPAYSSGEAIVGYDDIVGMRIVELVGYGVFTINTVNEVDTGVRRSKAVTCYSLEHEFTRKKVFIENGTYNFYNPLAPGGTIIDIILEYMPTWGVGYVDSTLIGKYRTFDDSNDNCYNFIKSTLQPSYNVIFDFDTKNRLINVRDVSNMPLSKPVFLSTQNLIQEISISEEADNVITVLDVNGAEGVDIREVNPAGSNKIYNLDYFISDVNFDPVLATKWKAWQEAFNAQQLNYFAASLHRALQTMRWTAEKAKLVDMEAALKSLGNIQSVYIQAIAEGIPKQAELADTNAQIIMQEQANANQRSLIDVIWQEILNIQTQQLAMNASVQFSNWFTPEQLLALNKYFKEDVIQESSFVPAVVSTYTSKDISQTAALVVLDIDGAEFKKIANLENKDLYSVKKGVLTGSLDGHAIQANIVRAAIERKLGNGEAVISLYLNSGNIYSNSSGDYVAYPSGCLTITGTVQSISDDGTPDPDVPGAWENGTHISLTAGSSSVFFTRDLSEFEQRSIEWELYDYGVDCLNKVAYPSYSFEVKSADFLAVDEFDNFKRNLTFGEQIYLDLGGKIITPLIIGVDINFDDLTDFALLFGDRYTASDSIFSLVDMVEEGVSMGKSLDFSKYTYSAFVDSGANTTVKQFMDSALDVAKNAVLSSEGQAVSWDSSGIHLRQWNSDKSAYLPEQIRMINNSIVFTKDGWNTAEMAIGKFTDNNLGELWGIVAPAVVGTLLAGNNLVIESKKQDGGKSVFKVDANGAVLHNSHFDLYGTNNGRINLDPTFGIAAGNKDTMYVYDSVTGEPLGMNTTAGNSVTKLAQLPAGEKPNANFWVDMDGNVYLKGSVYATDGIFSGKLEAATGSFSGDVTADNFYFRNGGSIKTLLGANKDKIDADFLNLKGISITAGNGANSFSVGTDGTITMGSGTNSIRIQNGIATLGTGVSMSWSSITGKEQIEYDIYSPSGMVGQSTAGAIATATAASTLAQKIFAGVYQGATYIDGGTVYSPKILGGIFGSDMNRYCTMSVTNGYFMIYDKIEFGSNTYAFALGTSLNTSEKGVNFYTGGDNWLGYNYTTRKTYPKGTWDFSSANITNLNQASINYLRAALGVTNGVPEHTHNMTKDGTRYSAILVDYNGEVVQIAVADVA